MKPAKMAPVPKRRKVDQTESRRPASLPSLKKDAITTSINSSTVAHNSNIHVMIQQAKSHAISQAQHDGCMANFRIFDSPFGNFLLPVVPTRAELGG